MTNEILNDAENQTKLKIVTNKYIKKIKIFLCKFSDKFYIITVSESSNLSEIVFFLHDIIICMNFIINLICLDVSDFSISDCKWFVDTSIEENSSFFFWWERNENAWRRDCLDCFLFLYFRTSVSAFINEINMVFLIFVDFFKSFCFSDW